MATTIKKTKQGRRAIPIVKERQQSYTQTPNDYFDRVLPAKIPPSEKLLILLVIRLTYGWHKRYARISYRTFERLANFSRQTVAQAINGAIERGFIRRIREGNTYNYTYCAVVKDLRNSTRLEI